ncbi:hypothetical protein [Lederbergia ruris]|uniref:hypothetical protein n=1 Tax=Lederbergia ruris TaxID=217495 RepID=UPI00130E1CBA
MKRMTIENKNGKGCDKTKEEASEVIKEMSPEELEAFKLERYRKFIRPLTEYHVDDLKNRK